MLTRETFTGPWAGLPVAWDENDRFDEQTHRANVRACAQAGMPGVYTSLKQTIDSFSRLCDGEGDDLPESAFMYVGTLDDAKAKAAKMAAETAV